jgi:hypothetical protein
VSYELIYCTNLTPWLALLPGVQFVQHPGADASLENAWVVGLRFEVTHGDSWRLFARQDAPGSSPVVSLVK